MRDWWKAAFILGALAIAGALLVAVVLQLIEDPVGAAVWRMRVLRASWPLNHLPHSPLWWALVGLVCVLVAIYVGARIREAGREAKKRMFVAAAPGTPPNSRRASLREAQLFQQAVIEPAARFSRITESVEAYTRSLKVRTTYLVDLKGLPRRGSVPLPVMLSAKGRLENGLAFVDSSGARVSSMNRANTMDHIAAYVRRLYLAADPLGAHAYSARDENGLSIADRIWRLVANDHGPTADVEVTARLNGEAEELYLLLMNTRFSDSERMFELCSLIGELIWNYPICLRIDRRSAGHSRSIRLTVERRVVPELVGAGSVALQTDGATATSRDEPQRGSEPIGHGFIALAPRLLDALRRLAGVPTSVITHDVTNAARAASYHLQIAGPPGYYAARVRLLDSLGRHIEPDSLGAIEADSATLRGQRHVHLYLRGARSARDTWFQSGFYERTPGSMAVATAAAFATLVVAAIIGAAQVGAALAYCENLGGPLLDVCLTGKPAQTGASEGLLQILLTFPIALVAMSAQRSDTVWGGVLVARVSNAAVVALTLAALALSVFANALTPAGLSVAWIVVIGAIIVILGAASASWIVRSLIHMKYVRNAAS